MPSCAGIGRSGRKDIAERAEELLWTAQDLARTADVMAKYADAALGFVDASVVAVAERLRIRELLTTDRRHFSLVRPRHCPQFDLRP